MRILYIHQYFTTPKSSAGGRSYEFARRLVEKGHIVDMLTSDAFLADEFPGKGKYGHFTADGINVHVVKRRYSNKMGFIARVNAFLAFALYSLKIIVKIPRPDVVFATSTPLTVGIPGVFASKYHRRPLVFEVRDLWPEAPIQLGWLNNPLLQKLARWGEKFIYRNSTQVVALSPGMAEGVMKTGYPADKISMIPNCSDLNLFKPEWDGGDLKVKEGLEGKRLCIYVGTLGQANGVPVLAEAAKILQTGCENAAIVIVGDGKEKDLLLKKKEDYQLDNLIYAGPRPRDEVVQWLAASELCLVVFCPIPVLSTTSPNKFFDYCAAGRPSLITNQGWIADYAQEYEAGVYSPYEDPAKIASDIAELLKNPEKLARMGKNARRLAEERFSRDEMAVKLESTLKSAVDNYDGNHHSMDSLREPSHPEG